MVSKKEKKLAVSPNKTVGYTGIMDIYSHYT